MWRVGACVEGGWCFGVGMHTPCSWAAQCQWPTCRRHLTKEHAGRQNVCVRCFRGGSPTRCGWAATWIYRLPTCRHFTKAHAGRQSVCGRCFEAVLLPCVAGQLLDFGEHIPKGGMGGGEDEDAAVETLAVAHHRTEPRALERLVHVPQDHCVRVQEDDCNSRKD